MSLPRPEAIDRSTLLPSINSWLSFSLENPLNQTFSRDEFVTEYEKKYEGNIDLSKKVVNLIFDSLAAVGAKQLEQASASLEQAEKLLQEDDRECFQRITGLKGTPVDLIYQYLASSDEKAIFLDMHTYYLRGVIYYERNFLKNAANNFKTILGLPDYYLNESIMKLVSGSLFYLGFLCERKNQYEKAASYFIEAMQYDINGTVLPNKMNVLAAEKYFTCALKLFKNPPKIPDKKNERAREIEQYLNAAIVHTKKKQHEFSIKDYDHAIAINPTSSYLYILRGNARYSNIQNLISKLGDDAEKIFVEHALMAADDYTIAIWLQRTLIDFPLEEDIKERYRKRRELFAVARLFTESMCDHTRIIELCDNQVIIDAENVAFGDALCQFGDKIVPLIALAKNSTNRRGLYALALKYFELANNCSPRQDIAHRIITIVIRETNDDFSDTEEKQQQPVIEVKTATPPKIAHSPNPPKQKKERKPVTEIKETPPPQPDPQDELKAQQKAQQKAEKNRLKNLAKKQKRETQRSTSSVMPIPVEPVKMDEKKKPVSLLFGDFIVKNPDKKVLSTVIETQKLFNKKPYAVFDAIDLAAQHHFRLSDSIKKNILIAIESLNKESSDAFRQALEKLLSKTTLSVVVETLFPELQPFQNELAIILAFKQNSTSVDPINVNKALGKMLKRPNAAQNFLVLVNLGGFYDIFPLLKSHHEAILKIMKIEDTVMQSDFTQLYDQFLFMMPTKESEPPHQHPHPLLKSHYMELNRYYATLSNHPNRFLKAKSMPEKNEKIQVEALQRVNTR